jgi:hypothetical protein
MTATFCVFNRTRESFLCLRAAGALARRSPDSARIDQRLWPGPAEPSRKDGIWLMRPSGDYVVGRAFPVDRVYLDPGNRVVQLIEASGPFADCSGALPLCQRPRSENPYDLFVAYPRGR